METREINYAAAALHPVTITPQEPKAQAMYYVLERQKELLRFLDGIGSPEPLSTGEILLTLESGMLRLRTGMWVIKWGKDWIDISTTRGLRLKCQAASTQVLVSRKEYQDALPAVQYTGGNLEDLQHLFPGRTRLEPDGRVAWLRLDDPEQVVECHISPGDWVIKEECFPLVFSEASFKRSYKVLNTRRNVFDSVETLVDVLEEQLTEDAKENESILEALENLKTALELVRREAKARLTPKTKTTPASVAYPVKSEGVCSVRYIRHGCRNSALLFDGNNHEMLRCFLRDFGGGDYGYEKDCTHINVSYRGKHLLALTPGTWLVKICGSRAEHQLPIEFVCNESFLRNYKIVPG